MRLDKFFTECGLLTRKESAAAARAGRIAVNGETVRRADLHIDPQADTVTLDGEAVFYQAFTYLMLNKPQGYVSSTEEKDGPCVLQLLPERERRLGLFPCGRLDKYTVGLMLLTNDGTLSHKLLSPKRHVAKTYRYACQAPLSDADRQKIEAGVNIGGYVTLPCEILPEEDRLGGRITLHEGKYHEIKRMFDAVGNKITALERVTFGPLTLDPALKRGEWRPLTAEELTALRLAPERTEAPLSPDTETEK